MTFKLYWKGEVIEEDIKSYDEAVFLKNEYNLSFGGGVTLK
jgi:hypothetical protein